MTLYRAIGALLIAIPFIPLERIFGEIKGIGGAFTPEQWLLVGFSTFTISWLAVIFLPENLFEKFGRIWIKLTTLFLSYFIFVGLAVSFLILLLAWIMELHKRSKNGFARPIFLERGKLGFK